MKSCLICHSSDIIECAQGKDFEYLSSSIEYKFLRCKMCGFLFLDPQPPMEELPCLYTKDYYTVNHHSPLFLKGFIYDAKLKTDLKRVWPWVSRLEGGAILDLGCGNAQRLMQLRRRLPDKNIRLVGVDFQFDSQVKKEASRLGIELYEANVESFDFSACQGLFDLVLMNQLLEHLGDPDVLFKRLVKILSLNARILIETPYGGGLDFLIFQKKWWGGYHFPRHLNIFSGRSLELFLKKYLLFIETRGFLPSPGFWIISLRNRLGLNSISRSRSLGEFLSFHNIFVVSFFALIDLLFCSLLKTSNQFVVAKKE